MGPGKNEIPTSRQLDALAAFRRIEVRLRRAGEERDPHPDEVSEELGLTRLASRRLLDLLEQKGVLERQPITIPGPRRVTAAGERWLEMLGQRQKAG